MAGKKALPPNQGALVAAGMHAALSKRDADAERRLQAKNEAGQFVNIVTEDGWAQALEMVIAGKTDTEICRALGVHSATLHAKRCRDADFHAAYMAAKEAAYIAIAEDTRDVARGIVKEDGSGSTGDVRRDELVVKTDLALAKAFARKIFGDKVEVEQKTLVINMTPNDGDLC